jgi:hypothetical protein
MLTLRRRLASCALALIVCQTAAVFAAPLWSCCASRHAASAEAEHDCCPAGSHPPGQCPRHAAERSRDCRLQCDAPHGVQFLIAVVGVLPAPAASAAALVPVQLVVVSPFAPALRPSVPHAPPPRFA